MKTILASLAAVVAALIVTPSVAQSDYGSSALRVKPGFWGDKLVAGETDRVVAKLGMFPSSAGGVLMRERSDEAADLYMSYRHRTISGSVMYWAGLALIVAAILVDDPRRDTEAVETGLIIGGAVLEVSAWVQWYRAREPLSRAVWEYNRSLVAPGAPGIGP